MTLPPIFSRPNPLGSVKLPAVLAGALALTALIELVTPMAAPSVPSPARIVPPSVPPAADVAAAAAGWSATILQRPLFRPDRRPLAPDAAAATPLPRLSAIVITAAGRSAIFTGDDGKAVVVPVGGLIDGDRITAIGPGQVTIDGSDGTKILRPQFAPNAQPDAAPLPLIPAHRLLDNY